MDALVSALVEAIERHIGPWTLEEFIALGELPAWPRLELIDGGLLLSPHATAGHQRVCSRLAMLFHEPAAAAGLEVFSPANLRLARQTSMPIPDIVVAVATGDDGLAVDADEAVLVVEVESPSTRGRDRLLKPDLYARGGIAHYWRVELPPGQGPTVCRYRLDVDTYRIAGEACGPGAEVDVTEPFAVRFDPADLLPGHGWK